MTDGVDGSAPYFALASLQFLSMVSQVPFQMSAGTATGGSLILISFYSWSGHVVLHLETRI